MNIYVGDLSKKTSEGHIRAAFGKYGKIGKISMGGQSTENNHYRFCFVEMPFENQARLAIKELHGKSLDGKIVKVQESGLSC